MKKKAAVAAVIAALILAAFLIYDGIHGKKISADFFAMNTYVSVKLTGADSDECATEIQQITESLDKDVLSRTSENSVIHRINQNGGGEIDEKVQGYISVLLDVCRKSDGAFDFTLGAVSDLWQFGSNPEIPNADKLASALSHSGHQKISLSGEKLIMADGQAVIDFGAAGKGIALDEIKAILSDKKIKEAVVSVGGSVLLMGNKQFTVGIRNPSGNSGSYIAKLRISESCVSTSGSYEQQFEQNGKIYHHILNPKTGYPVDNGLVSVTVVSESGILSDALSTACFVLGYEKGSELAKEFGCQAFFVTNNKQILAENGADDIIEITDNSYTLVMQ